MCLENNITGGKMVKYNEILRYFPAKISMLIDRELKANDTNYATLEEIRLRTNRPIILKFGNRERILDKIVESNEVLETLQHICDNSIYSYQNQICNGYITIKGGHRVRNIWKCSYKRRTSN